MDNQLRPGAYAYYIRHNSDGSKSLCHAFYDGKTLSGPVQCGINWGVPDMIAAPCVLWEPEGQYSGDGDSKIHLFLLVGDDQLWWLTSLDGKNFIVNSMSLTNIHTNLKISALLIGCEIHIYYNNSSSPDQELYHAKSTTDWAFQTTEPVRLASQPINLNWSCSAAMRFGAPNIAFNRQRDEAVCLIYLSGPDSPDAGNGTWTDISPSRSTCQHSPNLALLGDDLFITHQSQDDSNLVYFASVTPACLWSDEKPVPDALTVNGPGSCAWGDRLYCFFQSNGGNELYVQVYVNDGWLSGAKKVDGAEGVWYGIAAVAVHPTS